MRVYAFAAYTKGDLPEPARFGNLLVYKDVFGILSSKEYVRFEGVKRNESDEMFSPAKQDAARWHHFLLFCNDPAYSVSDFKELLPTLFREKYNLELLELTDFVEQTYSISHDMWQRDELCDDLFHALAASPLYEVSSRGHHNIYRTALARENIQLIKGNNPFYNSLNEELKRIETLKNPAMPFTTAPVAYLFQTNKQSDAQRYSELLVNALNEAGILASHDMFFLDLDSLASERVLEFSGKRFRNTASSGWLHNLLSEEFMASLAGNTLVITYGRYDGTSDYNQGEYALLQSLMQNINAYIDDIQIIFIVPEHKEKVVKRIEALINKTVLPLQAEKLPTLHKMSFKDACARAKELAEKMDAKPDALLEKAVKEAQKDYSVHDLQDVVTKWRDAKFAHEKYPAYGDILLRSQEQADHVSQEDAMAKLDSLIGLTKAKAQIKRVLQSVYAKQKRKEAGLEDTSTTLHLAFLGNPGTGKTTIARLYAEILAASGIIKENRVFEIKGMTDAFYSKLSKGKGSVIIIDEAYNTLGVGNKLAELATFMEENRDDTVIIVSGYKQETEYVLSLNPGLKSRFCDYIEFEDYTASEKIAIFDHICEENNFVIGPEAKKYLEEEIINLPGTLQEGNGRQVRNLFEKICVEQHTRLYKQYAAGSVTPSKETLMTLTVKDVKKALALPETTPDLVSLDDLVGLKKVKQVLKERLAAFESESYKIREGITNSANRSPMHMIFKGNPGTGKTEVARIVGNILKTKRVVGRGNVYEITPSDLFAPFGGTAAKVKGLFTKAVGSILFLDEAYALANYPEGAEAIAALMKEMDAHKNDVILIMAGYTKEMENLLSKNPGFQSRIAVQIEFPDYTEEELIKIFRTLAKREQTILTSAVTTYLPTLIANEKRTPDFGNGRSMRNILHRLKTKQGVRIQKEIALEKKHPKNYYKTITAEDFQTLLSEQNIAIHAGQNKVGQKKLASEKLDELIGLQEVKELIKRQIAHFKIQKERVKLGYASKQDVVTMHMAFTGAPGTGKTEVARLVAQMLKENGLLPSASFKEVGRQDLVGQYVGHTAPKIAELFKQSMGGVIFIDEAYSLLNGGDRDGFSQEAIDALIAQMENHKDDTVVILAGYKAEINALLDANAGFRSRIPNVIDFKNYSSEELYRILSLLAAKREYRLDKGVKNIVMDAFEQARQKPNFGNGRFARTLLEAAILKHDAHLVTKQKRKAADFNLLSKQDFETAIAQNEKLLVEKVPMGF